MSFFKATDPDSVLQAMHIAKKLTLKSFIKSVVCIGPIQVISGVKLDVNLKTETEDLLRPQNKH